MQAISKQGFVAVITVSDFENMQRSIWALSRIGSTADLTSARCPNACLLQRFSATRSHRGGFA